MQQEQFIALIEKYLAEEASASEQQLVEAYLDRLEQSSSQEPVGDPREREIRIWQNIAAAKETPVKRLPNIRRWVVAASVLLVLTAGAFWLLSEREHRITATTIDAGEIHPGKEGAILTMADGSKVILDPVKDTTIALAGGLIARIKDGNLLYEGKSSQATFNSISTPRGRQFHVRLPDGSDAWLNAESSIRYPLAFTGNERRIAISGEVYFEVKKHIKPFIVNAGKMAEVTVLGTSFNVNAYSNESAIATTLIEGAVKVSAGTQTRVIRPGQQARIVDTGKNNGITIQSNTNLEKVLAWKNGIFNFDDADLEEVMRQLERWYDIEVVYATGVNRKTKFFGEINKLNTLGDLLEMLEKSGVHFKMESNRKLLVMP
jgi:transmembrane sensor